MRIQLEKPTTESYRSKPGQPKKLIDRFAEIKYDEEYWKTRKIKRRLVAFENTLKGDFYHANFLEVLSRAYGEHYGVVVTPDTIWHTLLSEAVLIVSEKPQVYAGLFTNKPEEKQKISIPAAGHEMDLVSLMKAIRNYVPTNADTFLPDFSTSTPASRMARVASFADLVSPYYNYGVFACGIPHIDVQGSQEDWRRISESWRDIGRMLHGNEEYFSRTQAIVDSIATQTDNPEFWKGMIDNKSCGSGSQQELFGWFTDLYRTTPRLRTVNNFSTHIAKVCYEQLQSHDKYELHHGVFMSKSAQDCDFPTLTPEFGYICYHRPETPVEEDMPKDEWGN